MKISSKGMVCKTNEGQINLGGLERKGDTVISLWDFTIPDGKKGQEMVATINKAAEEGKRVELTYTQPWLSSLCHTSSGYFVTNVKVLDNPPTTQTPATTPVTANASTVR